MKEITEAFNVVIIGGGPAGISAGVWCAELGMKSVVIESRPEFGGQLLSIYSPITNYLGIQTNSGRELHDRFMQQFDKRDVAVRLGTTVENVDLGARVIRTANGPQYSFESLIIATGVRRRDLGIPGEKEFQGRGVMKSGVKDKNGTIGKKVVVVGGGDAALENILILSKHSNEITAIHRKGTFTARNEFVTGVKKLVNVRFLMNSNVISIMGNTHVDSVFVRDSNGIEQRIATDFVLVRIGVIPNSEHFVTKLEHDSRGYLIVDANCKTSMRGIYAVGDVANPISPTIATAAGMGASAAKSIYKSSDL